MAVLPGTLVDRVAKIITRYNMLAPGGKLGVAVSGGADSVVLLHILKHLAPRFATELTVLHANHELRGEESERDAEFVSQLASALGLPIYIERVPPGSSGNLEENARNLRREFFARARIQLALTAVALGHTRSDQAETVLFRFLRGAGTAGLSGMRFVSPDNLIRPLLATSRGEVRAWARQEGLEWREDSSNNNVGFVRNRLRQETIPQLEAMYNPNLEAVLAGMAEVAQDEENFWKAETEKALQSLARPTRWGLSFPVTEVTALSRALLRRLVRFAIMQTRRDFRPPDLQQVDAICDLCMTTEGHDRTMIPGVDAMRSFDTLVLAQPGQLSEARNYRIALDLGQIIDLPFEAGTACLEDAKQEGLFYANFKNKVGIAVETFTFSSEALTVGGLPRPLCVRNWRPGDELLRPGHRVPEKLKTLFQECKVPLWERRHWPVLVAGEKVVWARRFGVAASIATETASPEFRFTYAIPK